MKLRKMKSLVAMLVTTVSMSMLFTACGGAGANDGVDGGSVIGTYTLKIAKEDVSGNSSNNGFISAMGASQINTIVLNDDKSYEYTKEVAVFDETGKADNSPVKLTYKFTGKYSNQDNVVTLEVPKDCEFDEKWGQIQELGYLNNTSGKASNGDKVTSLNGESNDPLDYFLTKYYVNNNKHDSSVVVTVDKGNSSFSYNEVANSDDE